MKARIARLTFFPVKSCAGTDADSVGVSPAGIRLDREWMVVDENGVFVAQRGGSRSRGIGIPALCFIEAKTGAKELMLRAPDKAVLRVPLQNAGPTRQVRVWSRTLDATDEGPEAAQWLTDFLAPHRPGQYSLVRIRRGDSSTLGFVDDAALHVVSQSSLDDLNGRLSTPVPMDRFRPSIVLEGTEPYWEDHVETLVGESVTLRGGALCTRCPITATDQRTGILGKEPLTTLATYRRTPAGVAFGRYMQPVETGRMRVGEILSEEATKDA